MLKNRELVIFGLGDFARLAALYFDKDSTYHVAAFTADREYMKDREWLGRPVVAFEQVELRYPPNEFDLFVAIGFRKINRARAEVYRNCKSKGYKLASYTHSTVANLGEVRSGDNCFILENTIIQPYATIGNDVIIWAGSHIGHDSIVGDHSFIAPCVAISGNVRVEPYCFIGINATIRDGITIGEGCVIGAGVTILRNAEPASVFPGVTPQPNPIEASKLKDFS